MTVDRPIIFPQEIIDNFIDGCYDDTYTLRQCALTCRAWLPRSRHNLYYRIVLRRHEQLLSLSWSLSSSSELPELVLELVVEMPLETPATFVNEVCAVLARQIPRVRKLTVAQPRFVYPDARETVQISTSTAACISTFASVTHLALMDLLLDSLVDLIRIVKALPSLSVLQCKAIEWEEPETPADDPLFDEEGWLSLDTLAMAGSWDDVPDIDILFRAVDPQRLKHLSIDSSAVFSDYGLVFDDVFPVIHSFTALESLTIVHIYLPYTPEQIGNMQDTVSSVLGGIVSPGSFQRVKIDFTQVVSRSRQDVVETAKNVSSALDEALLSNPHLEEAVVEVAVADSAQFGDWWKTEFEGAFSSLHQRGILRVSVRDPSEFYMMEKTSFEDGQG
ncbi:hypothetical protein C8Q78DRAFT_1027588 [Trametes maxima]|nr:hypothetical protein C8Q78DRAFT_1027588 [Trametes maxima]